MFHVKQYDSNIELFDAYASFLLTENAKYNLTSITDPDEIRQKHFIDSLLLLEVAEVAQGASLLDIGSGAGFPGVPLKIARPDLQISLLESTAKKAAFLRLLGEQLKLEFAVINERAETAAYQSVLRGQFDFVVSRAVAALPLLCELCLPFVKAGGTFAAYKGTRERAEQELAQAGQAIKILGAELVGIESEQTEYGERTILLLKKISQTPRNYPRNGGVMRKKPL